MEFEPHVWYSPRRVLNRLPVSVPSVELPRYSSAEHKMLNESRAVALMLIGLMRLSKTEYWLQPVDPLEQTPDVRIAHFNTEGKLEVEDIEVVSFTPYSFNEELSAFLERTKLYKENAYPEKMNILCHIDGRARESSWQTIHESLHNSKHPQSLYVLHRFEQERPMYELARVHPHLDNFMKFHADYDPVAPSFAAAALLKFPKTSGRGYQRFANVSYEW